ERGYRILSAYVKHAMSIPGVKFVTARELSKIYRTPVTAKPIDRVTAARHFRERITFLSTARASYSAAELLQVLLGMQPKSVEGPVSRSESNLRSGEIPRLAFERAMKDAVDFIERNGRLPSEAFIGSEHLSLADVAATLALNEGSTSEIITMKKGNLDME